MKIYKVYSLIIFSLLSITIVHSQLVKAVTDLPKLKKHESEFIGKPLKDLLKEIALPIKLVYGYQYSPFGRPASLNFEFVDKKTKEMYRAKNQYPACLRVRLREMNFSWRDSITGSDYGEKEVKTKADLAAYEKYTIYSISVIEMGQHDPERMKIDSSLCGFERNGPLLGDYLARNL